MSRTLHARMIVLGAGPAGYTAGIYASRAMLEPMIISGSQPGGYLRTAAGSTATSVPNFRTCLHVAQAA
ncbi:hypothetical protein B7H23_04570 [Notoacmeibacter marinus]|uniref:Thioredoxin-disulfide reductase n=1 Tax=Notoacmeibacter marinus TaxID=1876515 RepID=A0A231V1Y4_9HYPH|nr:hypothetical protein B7H23_04570 [Notoacmeibacter marinus]